MMQGIEPSVCILFNLFEKRGFGLVKRIYHFHSGDILLDEQFKIWLFIRS